jgi:hypothetical protein
MRQGRSQDHCVLVAVVTAAALILLAGHVFAGILSTVADCLRWLAARFL